MPAFFKNISFLVLLLLSFVSVAQKKDWTKDKLSADEYRSDLMLLWEVMNESHPGLYRYTDSIHFQEKFELSKQISDSIPMHAAFYEFASFIQVARDGHTYIVPNDKQDNELISRKRFLPFTFKIIEDEVFIDQNFSTSSLKKGDKVNAIDGKPIMNLLITLRKYMTTDGFSVSAKNDLLEGQFWWYYGLHFGFKQDHHLVFINEQGQRMAEKVKAISYSDRQLMLHSWMANTSDSAVEFSVMDGVAYLKVSRFHGEAKQKYLKSLKLAFSTFRDAGCSHLVLDVRGNGGGREGFENALLSYLDHDLDQKYDEVCMKNISSSHYKYLDHSFQSRIEDCIYRFFEFTKNGDKWERRERFSSSWLMPDEAFSGTTYVLIDGEVFSSAADFAAMVSDYGNSCVLIGEETAGGYQGNTSGYFYTLRLPNSGFKVEIPRIDFNLKVRNHMHQGGVQPDIQVPDHLGTFIEGGDYQLQFVLDLIKKGIAVSN